MTYLTLTQPSIYFFNPPDWTKQDYKFGRSWYTRMLKSLTGEEERGKLRSKVKRKVGYSTTTNGFEDTSRVRRTLSVNKNSIWGCPLWHYEATLREAVSVGEGSLTLNGSPSMREIESGTWLMINAKRDSYEVVTVDSVSGDVITLTENLSMNWNENTKVYPILRSKITNVRRLGPIDFEHFVFSIEFTESFRAS